MAVKPYTGAIEHGSLNGVVMGFHILYVQFKVFTHKAQIRLGDCNVRCGILHLDTHGPVIGKRIRYQRRYAEGLGIRIEILKQHQHLAVTAGKVKI